MTVTSQDRGCNGLMLLFYHCLSLCEAVFQAFIVIFSGVHFCCIVIYLYMSSGVLYHSMLPHHYSWKSKQTCDHCPVRHAEGQNWVLQGLSEDGIGSGHR